MSRRLIATLVIVFAVFGAAVTMLSRVQAQSVTGSRSTVLQATDESSASATVDAASADSAATEEPFTLFNLNTATADDFLTIPDMNDRMVREYDEYRPYVSIAQFRKEIGKYVGDEQTAAWEKYIYVPILVDEADAATLKQIPGVTDEIAANLIAGRPYTTNDAFLTKLGDYLNEDQVDFARHYLEGEDNATATPDASAEATSAVSATTDAASASAATAQPFTLFNLNTATADDFLTIPDMNQRMVREYNEYRPYVSIAQFRKEIGKYVGDEQTAAWEKYIYVPILVDDADAATLKQIPGVTDEIATNLIAGRPYTTNDAFLTKLGSYLTPDQVAYAQNYLETK